MIITNKIPNIPYSRYDKIQNFLRKKRREILIFLEHSSCITAGINYKIENLLVKEDFLKEKKIDLFFLKRGGDFTAHEKGQLVIYPHIDLKKRNLHITNFLKVFIDSIQVAIFQTWKLQTVYNEADPGLYIQENPKKKIVSIGVSFKSFFTSFGAAINIQNNLEIFSYINPCGKDSKDIVSIKSLGLDYQKENALIKNFTEKFLQKIEERHWLS
ncbi:MAG: lipoyl(octanoyl) transferase LipB [Leptospiraceae bacterium]|nr:lipoyl(octanoyl) transferase LipB [Leptospiraceae bacterium]MCK6382499.1 lipoyl(octanoyl) transferase LipB [Leptospiraceae bacterium]NUM42537.1 lipoyl(octanoyl) transferase LipB [Leptospiraceae bacterium]